MNVRDIYNSWRVERVETDEQLVWYASYVRVNKVLESTI
jgi:hypothetical protein